MEIHQPSEGEWRIHNMRQLLVKIADHKEKEKTKIEQLEKQLKYLTLCLSALVVVQFTLNLSQTSVYVGLNGRVVGILSLIASINTFALALLGKLMLNTRKTLVRCSENHRRWDKAEGTFTMELSVSLDDDGKLSTDELRKLRGIYSEVADFVDGSNTLLPKKFSPIAKTSEHGSGVDHPQDPGLI